MVDRFFRMFQRTDRTSRQKKWAHVDPIVRLASSTNSLPQKFLGFTEAYLSWDRDTHEAALRKAERWVYGRSGIPGYESAKPDEVARLARRSLAQYVGRESFYSPGVRFVRRTLGFGFLLYVKLRMLGRLATGPQKPGAEARVVTFKLVERLRADVDLALGAGEACWVPDLPRTFTARELRFVWRVFAACPKLALYPHLLANFMQMMSQVATLADLYRPRAVIMSIEKSPHCSLITAYLHSRGIQSLNIMHGEHFFGAHSAFCVFDTMFAWSEHFADLYRQSRCAPTEYRIIGNPFHRTTYARRLASKTPTSPHILIIHSWVMDINPRLYNLAVRFLAQITEPVPVALRGHPSEGDLFAASADRMNSDLRKLGSSIVVTPQSGATCPLDDVLAAMPLVVGAASTVMLDAWIAGCKVIYLSGSATYESTIPRHGGSPNVMQFDESTSPEETALLRRSANDPRRRRAPSTELRHRPHGMLIPLRSQQGDR